MEKTISGTRALGLVLFLFLAASMMSAGFAAVEKVVNRGFETGNFSGWTIGTLPPMDLPIVTSVSHHSGSYSAMFETGAYIIQSYSTPFIASSDLIFYEASSGTGILTVTVTYSDGTSSSGTGTFSGTLPWRKVTFTVNHATKKVAKIRFDCGGGETMGVYLDDVSLLGPSPPTPGTITVTSPNGGQKWIRGTTHMLTWSSSGSPGAYVKIELMKGGVLNRVIASSTANDGSYSWWIPSTQTLGTDYRIKITSTTHPSISDSSNSNFAIVRGTLTVTSPNGGEIWRHGTVHTITWSKAGSTGSYVKIELLKGGVVNRVIRLSTANDGSYSWTISSTQTLGTDYKIRITSITYPSISDSSNSNFSIVT